MLLLAVIAAAPIATLELYRGAPVNYGTGQSSYQSVQDTYIESLSADKPHGGETVLFGGIGRTILIGFGDLQRVVPPGKHVVNAHLELTTVGGQEPVLRSIGKLKVGWAEGPYQSISGLASGQVAPLAPGQKAPLPPATSTWQYRLSGPTAVSWREPGAGGSDVEAISDAKAEFVDGRTVITGLGKAVQAMVDRPLENTGFALAFSSASEFASSQSPTNRPKLVLELADTKPEAGPDLSVVSLVPNGTDSFEATIKNVGSAPSGGFAYTWVAAGRIGATNDGGKSLAPGESMVISTKRDGANLAGDGRFPTLSIRINPTGKDVNPRNDGLEVSQNARWIDVQVSAETAERLAKTHNARGSTALEDWVLAGAQTFNDVYLDRSRFSFALDGARTRIGVRKVEVVQDAKATHDEKGLLNFFRTALGLPSSSEITKVGNEVGARPSNDPFAGLSGWGDTRFEGSVPGMTSLANEPTINPLFALNPLEPTGLLSASEVALLNLAAAGSVPTPLAAPRAIIFKAVDASGRPLPNTEMSFFATQGGKVPNVPPAFTLVTGPTGTTLVPSNEGKSVIGDLTAESLPEGFLVRASRSGNTEWSWLKRWQLFDAVNRGSQSALILDLRLNLSSGTIDTVSNFARERVVTDSAGSLPAKLGALTDESATSVVELPAKKGSWVEIDLGRDRTVGEIVLGFPEGQMWDRFDIQVYATGQTAAAALPWAQEANFAWTSKYRSDLPTEMHYRAAPRRFRFIRITNHGDSPGKLSEVKVFGAAVPEGSGG